MTNDKQQTAVEWYDNQLRKVFSNTTEASNFSHEELLEQAREMEKERMKGMYVEGSFAKMRYYDGLEYIDAEQYYEETYGGNK
jgi:hypothetical protein